MSESGGGPGIIIVLLLIAIAAAVLGYSGIAELAFLLAIGVLIAFAIMAFGVVLLLTAWVATA